MNIEIIKNNLFLLDKWKNIIYNASMKLNKEK